MWQNRPSMPCLLLILVLAFPRVILALMFLFSTYLQRAYHGLLVPLLGFLFLPLTTIVYAWMVNSGMAIDGVNLLLVIVAVIVDLGGLGGGGYYRRRRV
jgi:UDP-N-acetylmuramyl pentapeptide phosphotransferase/UDP-N-acetylglucosamine-1-phosphate transferase